MHRYVRVERRPLSRKITTVTAVAAGGEPGAEIRTLNCEGKGGWTCGHKCGLCDSGYYKEAEGDEWELHVGDRRELNM
jgi:hypothetical protein